MSLTREYLLYQVLFLLAIIPFLVAGCGGTDDELEPPPEPLPTLEAKLKLTVNGENCTDTTFTITCDDNRQLRRSGTYGGGLNASGYYKQVRQTYYLESPCFDYPLKLQTIWAGPVFSNSVSYSLDEAIGLEESSSEYEFYVQISFVDTNQITWYSVSHDNWTNEFERLDSLAINDLAYSVTNEFCTDTDEDDLSLFLNGIYEGKLFNRLERRDISLDIRLELENLYMGNYY